MFHIPTPVLRLHFVLVLLPLLVESQSTRQTAVDSKEFPYQVLISECDENPKCGGALVAQGFVVTSATCVLEFGGIQKFLKEALLYGGGASLLFNLGEVADAVIHPSYMLDPTTYDVAIVKYTPVGKGPQVNVTALNGTWNYPENCVFSSWWSDPDARMPVRLVWESVVLAQCSPYDPHLLCFADNTTVFFKNDYGSPIVCGNVLTGIVPRNGGMRAVNLTADYDWINSTITELAAQITNSEEPTSEETQSYLTKILQQLNHLTKDKSESDSLDHFTHWNNQVVVPLSYVLFALVIFFFVLLFFLVLFTVVLVYYSRK